MKTSNTFHEDLIEEIIKYINDIYKFNGNVPRFVHHCKGAFISRKGGSYLKIEPVFIETEGTVGTILKCHI